MENITVSITELQRNIVTYTPYSSHPDDTIVILGVRPNKAWKNQYIVTYRYLGSKVTYEMSFVNTTPFFVITIMEEVFA